MELINQVIENGIYICEQDIFVSNQKDKKSYLIKKGSHIVIKHIIENMFYIIQITDQKTYIISENDFLDNFELFEIYNRKSKDKLLKGLINKK